MKSSLLQQLVAEGSISEASYANIKQQQKGKLLSVHWEIKTILYLGVLLLSTGLGILIYKNIDTIGHQFVLLFIALVCGGCFFYCFKNKLPFAAHRVAAPNAFFDYVLLLGCCTFLIFVAYLQYQYNVFGNRYGLALFFPMLVLFFTAYYFDQLGVLSMAIVNLAAWLGLTVTPMKILAANDFNSATLIFTGLALGVLLLVADWLSGKKDFKKHFGFTYKNFGTHLVLICALAAMFYFENIYLAWFLLLMACIYFFYRKAINERSFYFILVITCYGYVAISYVVINFISHLRNIDMGAIYLGFLYFIVSGILLILFLINTNKKIKQL